MFQKIYAIATVVSVCILSLLLPACGSSDAGFHNALQVKDYVLGQIKNDTAAYVKESYAHIDSLTLETEDDCTGMYRHINKLTFDMHYAGNDAAAVVLLRHILDMLGEADSRTEADTRQMLNTYVRLGATFTDMGMPAVGLDYYINGIGRCGEDSVYNEYKAMLYNNIGIVYAEHNELDKAREYFTRALDINLERNAHHDITLNYANLAELFMLKGEIRNAQEAAQQCLDYIDQHKHPDRLANMRMQQGAIYASLKQYDVAMLRYYSALRQFQDIGDVPGEISANLEISENFLNMNHSDSARIYAAKALDLCRRRGRDNDMAATLRTLADISEAEGDYPRALALIKDSGRLSDSLRNEESYLRLNNWEGVVSGIFAGDKSPDHGPSAWSIIICTIAAALLGAATLLYMKLRRLRLDRRCLVAEHNEAVDKINRELTTLSLEKLKLHESLVDVVDNLRRVLLELNPKETAKRDHIRSLLNRLNALSDFNADDEFKLFFERVHPNFYATLSSLYPDLTSRDLRLCAFLYLGMTTKEIAALTYREFRSVESARNRLRKKLNLGLSEDLTAHLRAIAL